MSQGAKIRSFDALRDFRVALAKFGHSTSQALAVVDVEIRRTLDWLGHDQLKYWQHEVRRREELVNDARNELSRCLISTTAGGTQAACTEQKVALAKARKRLDEAREKVETVKRWTQIVEQEVADYRGPSQQLTMLVDGGLPPALAQLERKLIALEQYAAEMAAPSEPAPVASSSEVTTSRVATWPAEPPAAESNPLADPTDPGDSAQS